MRHQFPDLFFGMAPKGLTTTLGRGEEGKGPAVWPPWHSAVR